MHNVESIRQAVQAAVDALGGLDVMVCNAGLNVRKPTLEVTEADWDAVLDMNLRGVFFSAQAAAAQMVRQGRGGKIVSIASIMGLVGSVSSAAAYCASKAGVVNLTRVLAIEWAKHDIQVNSVAPTFVRTPLTEGIFENEAFLQSVLDRTPERQTRDARVDRRRGRFPGLAESRHDHRGHLTGRRRLDRLVSAGAVAQT